MSLNKAIAHNKEHRKQYRGIARSSKACRPHGGCEYCLRNRIHKHKKAEARDWAKPGFFEGYDD